MPPERAKPARLWTFLRIVWNDWSTGVTGSCSALLMVLALGISIASAFGARIPRESTIQLGTWLLAAVLGCAAAYRVWKAERNKVIALEDQFFNYELDVEFDPINIPECHLIGDNGPWEQFRMKVSNRRSGKIIHNCKGTVDRVESQLLIRPYVEKVPLTWAVRWNEDHLTLHDGDSYPLNVILMEEKNETPSAEFIRRTDAHNANPFNRIGEYHCAIILTSDETKPKRVVFTFDWTGNRKTAKVTNVKIGPI